MPRGVYNRKKKSTKAKAKKDDKSKHQYLVLTSNCGQHDQAVFYSSAKTSAAAEKLAEEAMNIDPYYGNPPKAVYIVKVEKTGKPAGGVVWS